MPWRSSCLYHTPRGYRQRTRKSLEHSFSTNPYRFSRRPKNPGHLSRPARNCFGWHQYAYIPTILRGGRMFFGRRHAHLQCTQKGACVFPFTSSRFLPRKSPPPFSKSPQASLGPPYLSLVQIFVAIWNVVAVWSPGTVVTQDGKSGPTYRLYSSSSLYCPRPSCSPSSDLARAALPWPIRKLPQSSKLASLGGSVCTFSQNAAGMKCGI